MADPKPAPSTAIVQFEPENLNSAIALAERMAQSELMPLALRKKPNDLLIIMMAGREMGLSAMQSIRSIHVIEGKPVTAAEMKVAQCLRRPDVCEYFTMVESTDKRARYVTKRKGARESPMEYTIEDAARANLTGKKNWRENPKAMLRARCSSALATAVYPDLTAGLYSEDEAEDMAAGHVEAPVEKPKPPPAVARELNRRPAPAAAPPPVVEDAQFEPVVESPAVVEAQPAPRTPAPQEPRTPPAAVEHLGAIRSGEFTPSGEVPWEEEKPEDIEAAVLKALAEAKTKDEARAQLDAIQKLPKDAQDRIRPHYGQAIKDLPAKAAADGKVAP